MKKTNQKRWTVILLALILCGAIDAQVYTPNGTLVYSNGSSGSMNIPTLEADAAAFFLSQGWTSLVTKIAPATGQYNCHGYVWYMLEGGIGNMRINGYEDGVGAQALAPNVTPDNVSKYWTDGSYVSQGSATIDAKVHYGTNWQYDAFNSEWQDWSDHSAVVAATSPTLLYESKWGDWGVYRHPATIWYFSTSVSAHKYYKIAPVTGPNTLGYNGSLYKCNNASGTVTWTVSNTSLFAVASSGNPITVTRIGTGTGNATLTAKNSSGTVLGTKTITASTPVINFNGSPTQVCASYVTFYVNNAPPSYSWGCSPNLTQNPSNPAQFKSNGNGAGYVIVKNSNNVEVARHNVWVGGPTITVSGPTSVSVGSGNTYYASPTSDYTGSTITGYEWELSPMNQGSVYSYGSYASIYFNPSGSYMVRCRATSSCGTGPWANIYVGTNRSPSPAYPNPVSDILNIDVGSTADANARGSLTFDVRLYDGQGNMLRQANVSGGTTVQFDVFNLPNGFYYLHIYDGVNSTPEMHQIIVRH